MSARPEAAGPESANTSESARSAIAVLERIEQRLAHVESTLGHIEALERTLPGALAGVVDTFDDLVERLRDRGVDVDERLRMLISVSERLTSVEALRALTALVDKLSVLQRLLESDVFEEASIDVVAKGGHALAGARAQGAPEVGLWQAARATSDEDDRRALGFLLRVAQLFGRSLSDGEPTPRRTKATTADGEAGERA